MYPGKNRERRVFLIIKIVIDTLLKTTGVWLHTAVRISGGGIREEGELAAGYNKLKGKTNGL